MALCLPSFCLAARRAFPGTNTCVLNGPPEDTWVLVKLDGPITRRPLPSWQTTVADKSTTQHSQARSILATPNFYPEKPGSLELSTTPRSPIESWTGK